MGEVETKNKEKREGGDVVLRSPSVTALNDGDQQRSIGLGPWIY